MAALTAVIEAVRRLPDDPDAVLMSGDLADHAADAEYEFVRESLARLGAPVYVAVWRRPAGLRPPRAPGRRARLTTSSP